MTSMSIMHQSTSVKQGGAFNLQVASTYSNETKELLKVMMEECRLSMLQRKRLQGYVNNGESLPVISKEEPKHATNRPSKSLFDVKQIIIGRKRTKLEITNMGAYEKEKVKPRPGVDKGIQKAKLQNLMAFGTEFAPHTDRHQSSLISSVSRRKSPEDQISRFEELMEDVRDRCQFLQDVAELGQADKYKTIMENEIASKLSSMKSIDPVRCDEFRHQMNIPCIIGLPLKRSSAHIH